MKMTVKQLAEICKKNEYCIECPLFHYKHLCDNAKDFLDLCELEFELPNDVEEEK